MKPAVFASALASSLRFVQQDPGPLFLLTPRAEQYAELQRLMTWKALDSLRIPWERIYQKRILAVLEETKNEALSEPLTDQSRVLRATRDVLDTRLPPLYHSLYDQVADSFAERADKIASRLLKQNSLGDQDLETRRWLAAQTGERIVNVTNTTVARVKKILDVGFTEGLTTDEIAKQLSTSGHFGIGRAWRIARTEVVSASNAGNHFTIARRLPNEGFDKLWLSSRDMRVRDTHFDADGQIADLDGVFHLKGGRLRFPGDSTLGADASEIVYCRCTTTYQPKRGRRIRR